MKTRSLSSPPSLPIAALALATLLGLAGASGAARAAPAADTASAVDVVTAKQGSVPYMNGGISKEQVSRIEHHDQRYNLHVVLSEGRHNDYVTGVRLRIDDAHGKQVLRLADAGPLTDVKLPPGTYKVHADFGRMQRGYVVQLKDREPFNLYLHFPHDAPLS
jgi:hypothetical protein